MSTGRNRLQSSLAAVRKPGAAATPQPPPESPAVSPRRRGVGPRWEDHTRRQTYHLENELIAALAEASARTGVSKSALVTEALRQYLPTLPQG